MQAYGEARDESHASPLEMVAGNLRLTMAGYARATPLGAVRDLPSGLIMISSGVDYPVFNAVLLTGPFRESILELESSLRDAASFYAARALGWSFWICHELFPPALLPHVRTLLSRARLREIAHHQGMYCDAILPPRRPLPRLATRRVADPLTRMDFCQVVSDVFGVPDVVSTKVYGEQAFWDGTYVAWVGYCKGKPVATVATDAASDAIGVYSVATVPKHRGKGFAEAITRHGLLEAQRASGLQRTILQSTPAGLALYQNMGYQPLGHFSVFIST
ncbi:MAG: GNAT family N-acetyltransferase [Acidobacteriia bacterium]|nr:GNAT family N-acetyltransferase [Terriglobia bacterium]